MSAPPPGGARVRRSPLDRDPERIEAMFDGIVPHYDLMNRLMTVGLDRRWRTAAAAAAAPPPGDAAARRLLRHRRPRAGPGARRVRAARSPVSTSRRHAGLRARQGRPRGRPPSREFVHGDLLALPFADARFAAVTVGWGVRNVADVPTRLRRDGARHARPAGASCASSPRSADGCAGAALPRRLDGPRGAAAGRARHRRRRGLRLPAGLGARVPPRRATWRPSWRRRVSHDVRYRRFGFGAVALHVGRAPSSGAAPAASGERRRRAQRRRETGRHPVVALGRPEAPRRRRPGPGRGASDAGRRRCPGGSARPAAPPSAPAASACGRCSRCSAARNTGPLDEPVLRAAAAVELLHMATLVHDDVLDGAELRRGRPTVAPQVRRRDGRLGRQLPAGPRLLGARRRGRRGRRGGARRGRLGPHRGRSAAGRRGLSHDGHRRRRTCAAAGARRPTSSRPPAGSAPAAGAAAARPSRPWASTAPRSASPSRCFDDILD